MKISGVFDEQDNNERYNERANDESNTQEANDDGPNCMWYKKLFTILEDDFFISMLVVT